MKERENADFDRIKPGDVVHVDLKHRQLFFFGEREGNLKFNSCPNPKSAHKIFFANYSADGIRHFLEGKARENGLVGRIFCDTKEMISISFREPLLRK